MEAYRLGLQLCVHRLLDTAWACSLTDSGHIKTCVIFERHMDFYKLFTSHVYRNVESELYGYEDWKIHLREDLWQEKQRNFLQDAIDAWQPRLHSLPFKMMGMRNRWTSAAATSSRLRLIRNVLRTLSRHERVNRITAIDAFEAVMLARLDRAFRDAWMAALAKRVLMASELTPECLDIIGQRVHAMYARD